MTDRQDQLNKRAEEIRLLAVEASDNTIAALMVVASGIDPVNPSGLVDRYVDKFPRGSDALDEMCFKAAVKEDAKEDLP